MNVGSTGSSRPQRPKVLNLDGDALLEKFLQETLAEFEESFDIDFSEGATIAEFTGPRKISRSEVHDLLRREDFDTDLPLIIISPRGFASSASDLAYEFENVVLCTLEEGQWVPWEIPA